MGFTYAGLCRGCQPGEQYDNNICRECQEQTYSFHPGDNKGQCLTCPDTAHCPGGSIFVPDDGYWHSSFDTDTVQRCPNTFACRSAGNPIYPPWLCFSNASTVSSPTPASTCTVSSAEAKHCLRPMLDRSRGAFAPNLWC